MSLQVVCKSASNLPNVERFGKSDPMCVIVFQGQPLVRVYLVLSSCFDCAGVKKKTKVIDNCLDPEWNEVSC